MSGRGLDVQTPAPVHWPPLGVSKLTHVPPHTRENSHYYISQPLSVRLQVATFSNLTTAETFETFLWPEESNRLITTDCEKSDGNRYILPFD